MKITKTAQVGSTGIVIPIPELAQGTKVKVTIEPVKK